MLKDSHSIDPVVIDSIDRVRVKSPVVGPRVFWL